MAKKSKKTSKTSAICAFVSTLFAILAVVLLICLPMVSVKISGGINLPGMSLSANPTSTYSGIGMIFGGEANVKTVYVGSQTGTSTSTSVVKDLGVNVLPMIAFIIMAIGAFTSLISIALKKDAKKITLLLSVALLIVGGILVFVSKGSTISVLFKDNAENMAKYVSLGYGAVISAILSILGGLASAFAFIKR